jgi:hypothetical protein
MSTACVAERREDPLTRKFLRQDSMLFVPCSEETDGKMEHGDWCSQSDG